MRLKECWPSNSKTPFNAGCRRCNLPNWLHAHTATIELSIRRVPAQAMGLTASHTIVITLVYSGSEGRNANMACVKLRNQVSRRQAEAAVADARCKFNTEEELKG